ncbi:hypothetical protein [Sphingomonas sp. VDB2]|uniref:hypothetical protein n=1 Tax=Sphingomonas sp. VDB2 TaxID=3228751 RepID=UPI003A7F6797
MGIGKIARSLGKIGLAIEGLGYVVAAGASLWKAIRRKRPDDGGDVPPPDGDTPAT